MDQAAQGILCAQNVLHEAGGSVTFSEVSFLVSSAQLTRELIAGHTRIRDISLRVPVCVTSTVPPQTEHGEGARVLTKEPSLGIQLEDCITRW